MGGGRKHDVTVILALVLLVVAFASFRAEFRLRPDMPVEFFDASRLPRAKRASEEKIAQAYWDCAVNQVQWKYGYAHRLPEQPSAEFTLSAADVGLRAEDEAARRYYWQKLRATWNVSGAWKTQYGWSSISLRQSLRAAAEVWRDMVRHVVGELRSGDDASQLWRPNEAARTEPQPSGGAAGMFNL